MDRRFMRVSIVIPAHNEERHLRACLDAIAAQTVAPYEVIVADNNSTDGTAAIARSYPFVTLVSESRQGIVYARNTGFDAVRGEVIGRIDADIRLPADWVAHVQQFYADPQHARQAWSGAGYFYNVRLPRLASWGYSLLAFGLNKALTGQYTLWGSNMAILRSQWQQVRDIVCLRTDIHEDLDLALHLRSAGHEVSYDRTIKTNAELRRVHVDRDKLWDYLQWWPRTLKIHGFKTWFICWFFGAFMLYIASFFWLAVDAGARFIRRPIPRMRQS